MKVKIDIPASLEEITLGQYQQFLKVVNLDIDSDEYIAQRMVNIFCGIDLKSVLLIKHKDVKEIVAHINGLFDKSNNQDLVQQFTLGEKNKVEFGFIPNLENISTGEYVDLDKYITDYQEMHKAMAVLYRPIKTKLNDKYTIHEYKGTAELAELMKQTPLSVVFGANVFFYRLGKELLRAIPNYLQQEMEELITASQHSLTSSGDGTTVSMR